MGWKLDDFINAIIDPNRVGRRADPEYQDKLANRRYTESIMSSPLMQGIFRYESALSPISSSIIPPETFEGFLPPEARGFDSQEFGENLPEELDFGQRMGANGLAYDLFALQGINDSMANYAKKQANDPLNNIDQFRVDPFPGYFQEGGDIGGSADPFYGLVNTTGFLSGSDTANNKLNIIPSNRITMDGVDEDIIAFPFSNRSGVGTPIHLTPQSGEYTFAGADGVIEVRKSELDKKMEKIYSMIKEPPPPAFSGVLPEVEVTAKSPNRPELSRVNPIPVSFSTPDISSIAQRSLMDEILKDTSMPMEDKLKIAYAIDEGIRDVGSLNISDRTKEKLDRIDFRQLLSKEREEENEEEMLRNGELPIYKIKDVEVLKRIKELAGPQKYKRGGFIGKPKKAQKGAQGEEPSLPSGLLLSTQNKEERRKQLQNYFNTQLVPYFEAQGMPPAKAVDAALEFLRANFPEAYNDLVQGKSIDSPTDTVPGDPFLIGNSLMGEALNSVLNEEPFSFSRPFTSDQVTLADALGVENAAGRFALDMLDPSIVAGAAASLGRGALRGARGLVNKATRLADGVSQVARDKDAFKASPTLSGGRRNTPVNDLLDYSGYTTDHIQDMYNRYRSEYFFGGNDPARSRYLHDDFAKKEGIGDDYNKVIDDAGVPGDGYEIKRSNPWRRSSAEDSRFIGKNYFINDHDDIYNLHRSGEINGSAASYAARGLDDGNAGIKTTLDSERATFIYPRRLYLPTGSSPQDAIRYISDVLGHEQHHVAQDSEFLLKNLRRANEPEINLRTRARRKSVESDFTRDVGDPYFKRKPDSPLGSIMSDAYKNPNAEHLDFWYSNPMELGSELAGMKFVKWLEMVGQSGGNPRISQDYADYLRSNDLGLLQRELLPRLASNRSRFFKPEKLKEFSDGSTEIAEAIKKYRISSVLPAAGVAAGANEASAQSGRPLDVSVDMPEQPESSITEVDSNTFQAAPASPISSDKASADSLDDSNDYSVDGVSALGKALDFLLESRGQKRTSRDGRETAPIESVPVQPIPIPGVPAEELPVVPIRPPVDEVDPLPGIPLRPIKPKKRPPMAQKGGNVNPRENKAPGAEEYDLDAKYVDKDGITYTGRDALAIKRYYQDKINRFKGIRNFELRRLVDKDFADLTGGEYQGREYLETSVDTYKTLKEYEDALKEIDSLTRLTDDATSGYILGEDETKKIKYGGKIDKKDKLGYAGLTQVFQNGGRIASESTSVNRPDIYGLEEQREPTLLQRLFRRVTPPTELDTGYNYGNPLTAAKNAAEFALEDPKGYAEMRVDNKGLGLEAVRKDHLAATQFIREAKKVKGIRPEDYTIDKEQAERRGRYALDMPYEKYLTQQTYDAYLNHDNDLKPYKGEHPEFKDKGRILTLPEEVESLMYANVVGNWKEGKLYLGDEVGDEGFYKLEDPILQGLPSTTLGQYSIFFNPDTEEVRYYDKYDLDRLPFMDDVVGDPYHIYGRIKKDKVRKLPLLEEKNKETQELTFVGGSLAGAFNVLDEALEKGEINDAQYEAYSNDVNSYIEKKASEKAVTEAADSLSKYSGGLDKLMSFIEKQKDSQKEVDKREKGGSGLLGLSNIVNVIPQLEAGGYVDLEVDNLDFEQLEQLRALGYDIELI